MTMGPVTIVGPGRMGLALGSALVQSDTVRALTVFGRRPEPPSHPLFTQGLARYVFGVEPLERDSVAVLLAVPDHALPEVVYAVAAQGSAPDGCCAFHLSGSLATDVLAPLHEQGYPVGALHPMQAVSDPLSGAERIAGSYVSITGAPEAVVIARGLVSGVGAHLVTIPAAKRPLYHAATVLSSGFLLPLLDLSARLLQQAGVPGDMAVEALLPLVRGTLSNVEERGVPEAVWGPLSDGDLETVALHLRALDPEDQRLYALFGTELLRLVGDRLGEREREAMAELLGHHLELQTTITGS